MALWRIKSNLLPLNAEFNFGLNFFFKLWRSAKSKFSIVSTNSSYYSVRRNVFVQSVTHKSFSLWTPIIKCQQNQHPFFSVKFYNCVF